jgi:hypothetical protein
VDEERERQLEALMRERKTADARLNRALNELLGTGRGGQEAVAAIEEVETVLRALVDLARQVT